MNRNIILGGVVIVIAIVAFVSLSDSNKPARNASQSDAGVEKQVVNIQGDINESANIQNEENVNSNGTDVVTGSYESYTGEKLAYALAGNVVLFFRASWCPTCRALDKDIKENLSNIPADLKILTVDYDNSSELKRKYGVTTQHTLVQVDKDGNMISKWSGSPTLLSLVAQVR